MTKDKLRKIIGENIRSERLARNMSIDELAELLELTSGFVGLIERGRRGATAYNIHKLSEIFGLSVERLYSSADAPKTTLGEDVSVNNKRRRLTSLSYDLTSKEMDFLIQMTKWLRQLRRSDAAAKSTDDTNEDDE